jgi:hypothetical protein
VSQFLNLGAANATMDDDLDTEESAITTEQEFVNNYLAIVIAVPAVLLVLCLLLTCGLCVWRRFKQQDDMKESSLRESSGKKTKSVSVLVHKEGEAPAPSESDFHGEKKAKPRFELRKGKTYSKSADREDVESMRLSERGASIMEADSDDEAPMAKAPVLNAPLLKAAAPADTDAGSSNGSEGSSTPSLRREISLTVTETTGQPNVSSDLRLSAAGFDERMAALGLTNSLGRADSMSRTMMARNSRAGSDGALPAADEAELNKTMPAGGVTVMKSTAHSSGARARAHEV